MNNHLRQYFDSLKLNNNFFYTVTLDLLLVAILFISWSSFSNYAQGQAELLGATSKEEIQQMITSLNEQQLEVFIPKVYSFLTVFLVGLLLLTVGTLCLYSLNQALIWNKLTNQQLTRNRYWRWNSLNLFLIVLILIYVIFAVILKLILLYLFTRMTRNPLAFDVVNNFLFLIFTLLLILFVYWTYFHFTNKYRIFESIGASFQSLKHHHYAFYKLFLIGFFTAVIPFLLSLPFSEYLVLHSGIVTFISVMYSILFLNWLRIYLVTIIHQNKL